MTVDELAEAAVASLPPKDVRDSELTAAMTLGEVGHSLHLKIRDADQQEWPKLWRNLTKEQRGALVAHLSHIGFAPPSIALEFATQEHLVRDLWEQYADKLGQRVTGIRLQTLVGMLQSRADTLYEEARKQGKTNLAWKIMLDLGKALQDFGVVERAVYKQEVTHKLELTDADKHELEELVKVRNKRLASTERLKQIEATPIASHPLTEMMDHGNNDEGSVGEADGDQP